jgi:hypothetical protein
MLSDPAPDLVVNDIRGFFTPLRNGPVHSTAAHRGDNRLQPGTAA